MPNPSLSDWSHGWAALSAIAALAQVVIVLWWGRRLAEESSHKRRCQDGMDQLAKLAIQYPELESPKLRGGYQTLVEDDPSRIRYENYCILVYNVALEAYNHEKRWNRCKWWKGCNWWKWCIWSKSHDCDVGEILELHKNWLRNEEHNKKHLHRSDFGKWVLNQIKMAEAKQ